MIFDVAIVGAGIAGASLAAEIAPQRSVILLEREDQPGYHTTGRSASFWDECYGGPIIQPLSRASFDFLHAPPKTVSESSFLRKRGVLYLACADEVTMLQSHIDQFAGEVNLQSVDRAGLLERVPGLCDKWTHGAFGPDCSDIDVAALHAAYLAAARRSGADIQCRAAVTALDFENGYWRIGAANGEIKAHTIVNAAGAWADQLAVLAGALPVGLTPLRRTIAQVRVAPRAPEDLPLVIHIGGDFYFKPDTGGQIWLSPHDETPSEPCDAAPEELDIAIALDRFSNVVDWSVEAITHKWAGLRTFAPDRLPVYGFDTNAPAFFWCAGQGGFGIQTAPAGAQLCASILLGTALPNNLRNVEPTQFEPGRFRS